MNVKVAGSYFNDGLDRLESVINISLEEGEVSISANSGDLVICMSKEDFNRVAEKIKNEE